MYGRTNAGRHSLDTRDKIEARQRVHELDEVMAGKLGLIEKKPLTPKSGLTITNAIGQFRNHKSRPRSVGGVKSSTQRRYNRILVKFEVFTKVGNLKYMTQVDLECFDEYVSELEEGNYALTTIVTEMTLRKGLHKFCIDKKLLDPRFGESSNLRWPDVDANYAMLHVRDESYRRRASHENIRQTKSGKSRKVPIHKDLKVVLKSIPRKNGRILSGPRGGRLRTEGFGKTLREQVVPNVIKIVGNEDLSRLTAHGFRHYFVSKCANAGVPQLSVMNWLGHSTARMTNYYYHSNEAASRKHMPQLETAEDLDQCDPDQ